MDKNLNKQSMPQTDKKSFTHKAGDAVERVGQKISEAGATKVGKAVYDTGNKIEHMNDKKKI